MESNGNKISNKKLKQKRRTKRNMNQNGNGFNATIFVCSIEGRLKVERVQTKAVATIPSRRSLTSCKFTEKSHRETHRRTDLPN